MSPVIICSMKKTEKKNDGTKANVEEKKEYGVAWIVGNCKGYMGAYHDYTSYAKDACPMTKEEAESILKSNDELSIVVSVAEFANNAKDSLNVEIDGATVWARKNERGVDIGIQIKTNGGGRFDVMVENISVDSNVEKNVFGAFAKMKADAYEKKISYEKIVETLSDEAESKRKEEDFERSLGLDDEK